MAILNETSIVYVDDSLSVDSRYPIVADVWCEGDSDLPTRTQFSRYVLCTGSRALTPNKTYVLSGSTWVEKEESPFKDVYTKTEVDTALSGKQATLVSGTNIKTVGTQSLSGSGNIAVLSASVGTGSESETLILTLA